MITQSGCKFCGQIAMTMEEMYTEEKVPEKIMNVLCTNIREMADGELKKVQYTLQDGKKLSVAIKDMSFDITYDNTEKKKATV